jgi:hypothetical protein
MSQQRLGDFLALTDQETPKDQTMMRADSPDKVQVERVLIMNILHISLFQQQL